MYDAGEQKANPGPLNWRTFGVALSIHLLAGLVLWGVAKIAFRPPEVIIPIDMTVVPPWAEEKPDDPDPDPNPPTPPVPTPPKPEPKPVEEPPKLQETKQDAVIKEKPKPKKKEFKRSTKLVKQDKKVEKKETDFRKNAKLVKAPPTTKYGKATAHDKPMTLEEIKKWMDAGARIGTKNQLAANEEQRCLSLIRRKFYESWDVPPGAAAFPSVHLTVKFGPGGRIVGYEIARSSGNASVDQSVLAAAKRAGYVAGLSPTFLQNYPVITIDLKQE